jgi:TRAP-type C4-dicarboxylate transport system permease small subunit
MSSLTKLTHLLEDSLLMVLLASMIILASGQIILRNFFDFGYIWIDPLLRLLVLWTGLIGAAVASRDNRHIRIDLLSRYLSKDAHLFIQFLVGLFTTFICTVIAWHGASWVHLDYEGNLLGFQDLPAWVMESIIPLAFGLIALRYLLLSATWFITCFNSFIKAKQ